MLLGDLVLGDAPERLRCAIADKQVSLVRQ